MGVFGVKLLSVLIGALSLVCSSNGDQTPTNTAFRQVSIANTLFAGDLYAVLRKAHTGNLVCSPISVSAVMAMIKNGARGTTSEEIQRVMHFPIDDSELNAGFQAMLESLKGNGNFTLEIANKVYSSVGFQMNPDYNKTLKDYYGVQIEQLDFRQRETSADSINAWVEEVTHNKIQNLISASDLDPLTRLVLVNGIYFKGRWQKQFDPKKTHAAKFYVSESKQIDVNMMTIEDEFPYTEIKVLSAKAVALPYQGGRLSMVIILPDDRYGMEEMEQKMKTFDFSTLPSMLLGRKMKVQLPKFKVESTIDLMRPLEELGLTSIFSSEADFNLIPKHPLEDSLYVSKAIQKAFIEVNEEGSEAAAATGVELTVKSAFPERIMEFQADHPFIAVIVDGGVATQLFWTRMSDPSVVETKLNSSPVTGRRAEGQASLPNKNLGSPSGQGSKWSVLTIGLMYAFQRAL